MVQFATHVFSRAGTSVIDGIGLAERVGRIRTVFSMWWKGRSFIGATLPPTTRSGKGSKPLMRPKTLIPIFLRRLKALDLGQLHLWLFFLEIAAGLSDEDAYAMVESLIEFYDRNCRDNERMGSMIDRMGLEALKAAVVD